MRSIRYTKTGYACYDVPEPQIVQAGEVKIKVAYASICGSDIHTIKGDLDEYFKFEDNTLIPLGHEASGIVVELGPEANVKGLQVGDKVAYYYNTYCGKCYFCRNGQEQFCLNVTANGSAMSDYMVLSEQQVFKLPDEIDLAKACLIEPITVSLHGIDMCRIKAGNKVAISGGGGIGLIMVQLAKLSGAAKLTLIEPVAEKRELGIKLGADFTIDPASQNVVVEGKRITGDLGYDVVIETSGVPEACQPAYDILSRGGILEFFAIYARYKFPLDLMDMWDREATVCSVFQSPYMFPRAIAVFDRLNLDDFVKWIFQPEDCVKAFETQMTGKPAKVMFEFTRFRPESKRLIYTNKWEWQCMFDHKEIERLQDQACAMRKNLLQLCHLAGALHIGGDLSMTDLMTVLYQYGMKFDPKNPEWDGRDRFILSKGHGAGALYISQAMAGFYDVNYVYENYDKLDSPFGIHPSGEIPGVEISTGSLGHGLSICIGMGLAARLDGKKHRIFTLLGDGEIQEGSVWEAAMAASHYKLGNIVAIIDRNGLSLDGETESLMKLEPLEAKWQAFGWNVKLIDGHDMEQIVNAIDSLAPADSDIPTVIIAKTVKGKGVSFMENDVNWHAGSIDSVLLEKCCAEIDAARSKQRGA